MQGRALLRLVVIVLEVLLPCCAPSSMLSALVLFVWMHLYSRKSTILPWMTSTSGHIIIAASNREGGGLLLLLVGVVGREGGLCQVV